MKPSNNWLKLALLSALLLITACANLAPNTPPVAELLAELDQLATVFATEADRNRISGLACEKAYEQAREMY